MRFASDSDMPPMMSCLSKAVLVFRTRRPSVTYIQKTSRDMRARYGEDLRTVDITEPELMFSHPIANCRERGLFLFLLIFFIVLVHFFVDFVVHPLFDFFLKFIVAAMSAAASQHVA